MGTYPWVHVYQLAILETDGRELPHRLLAAKASISVRIAELEGKDSSEYRDEKDAIAHAIRALKILEKERLVG